MRTLYTKARRKIKELKDPWFWQDRFIKKILVPILFRNNYGTYILKEQWDHLIILDACRYDAFEEIFKEMKIGGRLEYIISRGSNTKSFLSENFGNERFEDIIYIAGNPHVSRSLKGKFYKTVPVWKTGWDEALGTVPPSAVYESTLKEIQKHPDKRFIIHFVQPHYPYITLNINLEIGKNSLILSPNVVKKFSQKEFESKNTFVFNPFKYFYREFSPYVRMGREALLQAHKENLRWVMPYVKELMEILQGKVVVTSDHGDAFGERIHPLIPIQVYFHPVNIRIPVLVKVPWLVVEGKGRINKGKIEEKRIRLKIERLKQSGKI